MHLKLDGIKNKMAQKRMFDRAIIDTDRFMDLPMSAKAIYFLLGMEADDEGFVSYKKVIRIHGGNEDDVKILTAKRFLISFPSGVVVITDWNKNNWLDDRRTKATEYQKEKNQLILTDSNEYELSNGLARGEENRGEQRSIGEKIPTPSEESVSFFEKGQKYQDMVVAFSKNQNGEFIKKEMDKFILYWTEPNKSGTKVRWQQQSTFEVKRRLFTWLNRAGEYKQKLSEKEYKVAFV